MSLLKMLKNLTALLLLTISLQSYSQETRKIFLSGTDKDHTVNWGFHCDAGQKSHIDTVISVPSNWELQGFGNYTYGQATPVLSEIGYYSFDFLSPDLSGHKNITLVFEGVMTDAEVTVNGILAGREHQGGFYRFKYDITKLLHAGGSNLLKVRVKKTSANKSVNNAERRGDFWEFGGIYRPVYLEITPEKYIDRIAINARADGSFQAEIFPVNLHPGDIIEAQVQELNGNPLGKIFSVIAGKVSTKLIVSAHFDRPRLWSAEFPNRYQVKLIIRDNSGTVHSMTEKFGFRTAELHKNDGFYLNNTKIIFKGSNRHSFWPESGRTLSHTVHVMDVRLMKEMNMNAVRMSHYPPDPDFLSVCDSLGLYVLDELTGWQAAYDDSTGHKLVAELVRRDVNHPSVLIWDNGNEGGFNLNLDSDYALFDPQNRLVIHPWAVFNGTNTKHYPNYNYVKHSVETDTAVFFPTEFMHGLYDGGAGAGLDDFWNMMIRHPHGAGGFIWAFLDEAVVRTDKHGVYDTDGNHAPDGIVGPHREKEASFFTIKNIWSPVYIANPVIDKHFKGIITVENRYSFTSLRKCTLSWKLVHFTIERGQKVISTTISTGLVKSLTIEPGKSGKIDLHLGRGLLKSNVLYLTAKSGDNQEICSWSWVINSPLILESGNEKEAGIIKTKGVKVKQLDKRVFTTSLIGELLLIKDDDLTYVINRATGLLQEIIRGKKHVSLSNGPVLAGDSSKIKSFNFNKSPEKIEISTTYSGKSELKIHWTFKPGHPVKFDYQYRQRPVYDFSGISFSYPQKQVLSAQWLGRGPYRVWKNRLKGMQYGIWQKKYNNAVTGENWVYPEFNGYYADVKWIRIITSELPLLFTTNDEGQYFQLFKPQRAVDSPKSNNVDPPFPSGSFSFLNAIPAIGTKFQSPLELGPQSQQTISKGETYKGSFYLEIGR